MRRSAPLCSRWLAKAWRSTCGLTSSRRDARRRRQLLQVAREMLPRQMAALAERGKQPFRSGSALSVSGLSTPRSRRDNRPSPARRFVERHQPFLVALAAHHDHAARRAAPPTAAAPPVPRRAGPWRRAPRAGRQPQRAQPLRRRSLWPSPDACAGVEQAVDIRDRQDLRQAAGRASGPTGSRRDRRCGCPRVRRKRNRCRIADSWRATLDDLKPRVSSSAR